MDNKSRKGLKRRSSIITILIVLILLAIAAFITIKLIDNNSEKSEKEEKAYITNLDEEDKMQYEYSKISNELKGMYAFGISQDKLVGVVSKDKYVDIVSIDPTKEYDYNYSKGKLYLLEKESGKITVYDLKEIGKEEQVIELNCKVESFELYNDNVYYISDNKLFKYNNDGVEEVFENVTSKNFVIKNDTFYLCKDGNLIKSDMEKNETVLDNDAIEVYYYNYYERDRLIYDTTQDNENLFKNIYNFYTGDIINSIKNDTYFVPYSASNYIYTTLDNKNVIIIEKSGMSEYLYKSQSEIKNINLYKEGYISIKNDEKETIISLETYKEIEDNINDLYNIKYLK